MGSIISTGTPSSGKSPVIQVAWHKPTESEKLVRCCECGCDEIEIAEFLRDGKSEFTPVCCWCRVCPVSRKIRKFAVLAWNKHNQYFHDYKALMRSHKMNMYAKQAIKENQ